jgi:NifU-like protein involved in Fe-S cluster formation
MPPFSPMVMDHFLDPRNVGTLPSPSGEGWSGSFEAGRFMRLQVLLEGGVVREARYQTYGCAPAIAAGSWLTEWVRGRTVGEARALTPAELEAGLGGLPPRRRFCAALAVDALRQALHQALSGGAP